LRSLPLRASAVAFLLALTLSGGLQPLAATCGGGGGGGLGGISTGTGQTYQVPWTLLARGGALAHGGRLVLYWFPTSAQEARASELQTSRDLTLWSMRCVSMAVVKPEDEERHRQLAAAAGAPAAVLVTAEGTEVGRVEAGSRGLAVGAVEKLVGSEIKRREAAVDAQLDEAKAKEKAGDAEGAATLYGAVWTERCLVPGAGRKAAKALKRLGKPVPEEQSSALGAEDPLLGGRTAARVVRAMDGGLAAEDAGDYRRAERLYREAHQLDPADPVPLRYLGELYRHHTGEWDAARRVFGEILAGPADPISRAVALHGLGKMTIHDGRFAEGLALFEQSVAVYPLALTYRNLAVYWNSAGETAKAQDYVDRALALDPDDAFNLIFAATYLPGEGRRDEALRLARANEGLLAASYNLAAIHALLGDKAKALALLKRHFFHYERFDAVRAREMKEAREDVVFASLHDDPEFLALTRLATTMGHPMPAAPAPAGGR